MSKPQQGQAQEFRCFHCNEVFSGEAAKKHFGSPYNTPFHLDKVLALTRESALFEAEQLNLSDTCPDTDCDHSSCIVGRNLARQVRALAASRSEEATPQEKVQQTVQPARGRDENTASIPLALETSPPTTADKSVEYSAETPKMCPVCEHTMDKVEVFAICPRCGTQARREAGAPAAGSTERWIPVSELPKSIGDYLVFIDYVIDETRFINWEVATYGAEKWPPINATHWKELDQPGTDTDVAKEK